MSSDMTDKEEKISEILIEEKEEIKKLGMCIVCKQKETNNFVIVDGADLFVCSDCLDLAKTMFLFVCVNCGEIYSIDKNEAILRVEDGGLREGLELLKDEQIVFGLDSCIGCETINKGGNC